MLLLGGHKAGFRVGMVVPGVMDGARPFVGKGGVAPSPTSCLVQLGRQAGQESGVESATCPSAPLALLSTRLPLALPGRLGRWSGSAGASLL